jgi:hypothetical protein
MKPAHWMAAKVCVHSGRDQAGVVTVAPYVGYLIVTLPRYLTHCRNKYFLISDYKGRSGWSEERFDFLECTLGESFKYGERQFEICMGSISHRLTAA